MCWRCSPPGGSRTPCWNAPISASTWSTASSPRSRQALDIIALLALNLVAWTIALNAYPVLAKSLANGTTANTPLATPLWIPQLVWLSGYAWFAITTSVLGVRVLAALFTRDAATIEALAGPDKGDTAREAT